MNSMKSNENPVRRRTIRIWLAAACVLLPLSVAVAGDEASSAAAEQTTFNTPEEAAMALIDAAENADLQTLAKIFGPDGTDMVITGDAVQDENQATGFAAEARIRAEVVQDLADPMVATLIVGPDDWPLPIPIVEVDGRWHFDTAAGRQEILHRRIGANELDAIEVCRGFVEAQYDYAYKTREGMQVNQFAQRIISSPGTQDGLAWQDPDGSWQGPVGEAIAKVIAEGYTEKYKPFHGYFFKVLKGQGPDAPLGEMGFVVEGVMIGGFALVAAPSDYEVTGVMTFIVGQDGVVYQQDLGPTTLEQFRAMELYNPGPDWTPVEGP